MFRKKQVVYKTANCLPPAAAVGRLGRVPKNQRRGTKIAVIDDRKLSAMEQLLRHGYELTRLTDVESIEDLEPFQIICCDLNGVGKKLDNNDQGAAIIRECELRYPNKYIIAYTGSALSDPLASKARALADDFLRKDADLEEWQRKLDRYIIASRDTQQSWQRTRMALVEQGIDTFDLLKIEDAFVRSILDNDKSAEAVKSTVPNLSLSSITKEIVIRTVPVLVGAALV